MTSIDIERFHAGDPDYFRTVHARVHPILARHVRRFVPDIDDRQDVLQEIWIRIFEHRAAYSGTGSFDGWAIRIAHRFCLMRRREVAAVFRERVARYWALEVATESRPEREAVALALQIQELHDATIDAIMALPPRQRTSAIARWLAGRSIEEIAALLHVAPGTVKATLHHARKNLRAALTGVDPSTRNAVDVWIHHELPTPLVHGCLAITDNWRGFASDRRAYSRVN